MKKTYEVLRYNIEIAEEGNSKAILVLTSVTIVSLPLSFVSSFFSMNTISIRNSQETQPLFWVTDWPTTVAIGSISLLVSYKGSDIGDWRMSLPGALRQRRDRMRRARELQKMKNGKNNDEEAVNRDALDMRQVNL